jgi:hypothetical protein
MLLRNLCRGIEEPAYTFGRPRISLAELIMIFSVTLKIYSTVSARRFMTDLREAVEKGYITKAPHYNSIFNYWKIRLSPHSFVRW